MGDPIEPWMYLSTVHLSAMKWKWQGGPYWWDCGTFKSQEKKESWEMTWNGDAG